MSSWPSADSRESQYGALQRQHINEPSYPPFIDSYCNRRMKRRVMTTPTCKPFITFIHADSSTCERAVERLCYKTVAAEPMLEGSRCTRPLAVSVVIVVEAAGASSNRKNCWWSHLGQRKSG
ncbi:ribonuclease pancreatic-like [Alligator mississippiensis]|uniref:ribonuclease pancreatic-like n=1 Tax=Alligator mississippiensis TaxID=8496 RepID=UPI00287772E6|nr:ribonuclease pancreatic-like [Alligator mississippiensis]